MGLMQAPPPPPIAIEVVEPSKNRFRKYNATTFTVEGTIESDYLITYVYESDYQADVAIVATGDRFEAIEEKANTSFTMTNCGGTLTNSGSFTTNNYKSELTTLMLSTERYPFDVRDVYVMSVANELFADSTPLEGIEAEVLDRAFRKYVKRTSTLPNRL